MVSVPTTKTLELIVGRTTGPANKNWTRKVSHNVMNAITQGDGDAWDRFVDRADKIRMDRDNSSACPDGLKYSWDKTAFAERTKETLCNQASETYEGNWLRVLLREGNGHGLTPQERRMVEAFATITMGSQQRVALPAQPQLSARLTRPEKISPTKVEGQVSVEDCGEGCNEVVDLQQLAHRLAVSAPGANDGELCWLDIHTLETCLCDPAFTGGERKAMRVLMERYFPITNLEPTQESQQSTTLHSEGGIALELVRTRTGSDFDHTPAGCCGEIEVKYKSHDLARLEVSGPAGTRIVAVPQGWEKLNGHEAKRALYSQCRAASVGADGTASVTLDGEVFNTVDTIVYLVKENPNAGCNDAPFELLGEWRFETPRERVFCDSLKPTWNFTQPSEPCEDARCDGTPAPVEGADDSVASADNDPPPRMPHHPATCAETSPNASCTSATA